ncbi:MAG TPA: three-Cys-motif partner protein TcmP [Acidimicrobiales bacterium]|nr:three-Cys-motif partner protein TcmP [Acidimicrobiales bacterium]
MRRSWGYWTRYKLDLLQRYLSAFTSTTKNKSSRIVYLDLFAGQPDIVDRVPKIPRDSSPRLALCVDDPPFTDLRFFELVPNVTSLRQALTLDYVTRNWLVYEDSNASIGQALADLRFSEARSAPTFAFIDPHGPHCKWQTLESLAAHKGPPRFTMKVELWMLFPDSLFSRLMPKPGEVLPAEDAAITAMFGDGAWHAIWWALRNEEITPEEAREEYVNLLRWRLETELGYRWTHQLEIRNTLDAPMCHMLFATDSEAGHRILSHLYDQAANEFPNMAQDARRMRDSLQLQESGQFDFFSSLGGIEALGGSVGMAGSAEHFYEHQRAEEPRFHDRETCPYCL